MSLEIGTSLAVPRLGVQEKSRQVEGAERPLVPSGQCCAPSLQGELPLTPNLFWVGVGSERPGRLFLLGLVPPLRASFGAKMDSLATCRAL